jgi:hypothetical protein
MRRNAQKSLIAPYGLVGAGLLSTLHNQQMNQHKL